MTEQIQKILNQYAEGNVVYVDRDGQHAISFDDLLSTSSEDILTKTNRTEATLLRLAEKNPESLKWVNDYAMAKIVERLHEINRENESQLVFDSTEIEKLRLELERMRQSSVSVELSDELMLNNNKLKNDYSNLVNELDEINKKHETTLNEYDKLMHEKDEIISKINKQLEDKIEELNNVNNECSTYAAELDKASGKYHLISFKFDELTKKFEALQKSADEEKEEKNILNEQLNKANNDLDNSISRYNILQDEFKKLSADFDELKTDNANISKQLENLKNAEERLVIERDTALENESIAIKQHDKIRDERDALNEQLSRQKSDNELLTKIRELLNIESPQHVTKKRDVENNTTTRIGSNQVSDFNIL